MSSSEFREGVGMTMLWSAACFSIVGGDEDCRPGDVWLRSGDLAYYEEMGNIFLVDRLKELIKYKAIHASV